MEHLLADGKSHNTIKNYNADLNCFFKFLIATQKNTDIDDFNEEKVKVYAQFINDTYASSNSRRRRVQALRLFFDYLIKQGIYTQNPIKKIQTSPKFLDIPRPASLVEIKKLWWHLEKIRVEREEKNEKHMALIIRRNQIIIQLIYGSGLKVSDIEKLSEDQISLSKNNSRVMLLSGKKIPYSIPLPPQFRELFKEYQVLLAGQKNVSKVSFTKILFNANPYQILSGGISSRGLEIIFEEFRNKFQVNITPKSLRQACIFKWLTLKIKESTIKEWLGFAPSYSLKPYRDRLSENLFEEI